MSILVEVPYGERCPNKDIQKTSYENCKNCEYKVSLAKTFSMCHLKEKERLNSSDNILGKLADTTAKVNDYISSRYHHDQIVHVFVFEQVWGSTSLGFGGIGGSTMTSAWTHVISTVDGKYHIFFNGRHAYTVDSANEIFKDDLMNQNMRSIDDAIKYYQ